MRTKFLLVSTVLALALVLTACGPAAMPCNAVGSGLVQADAALAATPAP